MSEETAIEQEARKDGWAPESEWKGDPDKWKTAEKFVEDGKNINGILRSKLDKLEARVGELTQTNKEIVSFTNAAKKRDRAEKERLVKELQAARTQAVTDGDGAAFEKADKQINEIRNEGAELPDNLDPMAQEFLKDNTWYGQDDKLTAFADGVSEQVNRQGYTGEAYFAELVRRTKETFPEDFENPKRKKANGVETGGQAEVDSQSRTFDNLPKDAKDQFERFKRDMPEYTQEEYVEQYDWEQED